MPSVELDALVERLRTPISIASDRFGVAHSVSNFCARNSYDVDSQELVLRSLNHLESFGSSSVIIQGLARECGLFPYLDLSNVPTQDLFAAAIHRLPSLGPDFVLHREQRKILDILNAGKNVVLSAPTSFGKSALIDALIAENQFENILILVPTIALMDETRRRLTARFSRKYKIITQLSQDRDVRNIFVLTPERANLAKIGSLGLFIIDEFYKLGQTADKDRHSTLNKLCYRLLKTGSQFFMLGPNIDGIPEQLNARCEFEKTSYKTVAANVSVIDLDPVEETIALCRRLGDSTIVFCRSPDRVREVTDRLIEAGITSSNPHAQVASQWAAREYHAEWHYARGIAHGIGVHHGSIPRSLAHWSVKAFNEGWLNFLLCTTTLIEGVNTRAENLIILDSKVNRKEIDFFTFNNIKGRAGRMMKHFVGNVFSFRRAPQEDLPFVDFEFFTQPETTSSSILLELDEEDLTAESKTKVSQYKANELLSWETLRQSGLDPSQQLSAARTINENPSYWALQFDWTLYPRYEQLNAISGLMWASFSGGRLSSGAVRSADQLTVLILSLRTKTVKQIIDSFINFGGTPNEGVQKSTSFIRGWATFHYPRLLLALNNIAREVLGKHGFGVGDMSAFAAQVENLFHDAGVTSLDEYGIPLPLAFRLEALLAAGDSLDGTLERLRQLDISTLELDPFEVELLLDTQASLA